MSLPALDLESDLHPVSEFRANAAKMLAQIKKTGHPLVLTQRGRGAAVVLDIGSYQALLDRIDLLESMQRGLDDIAAGRTIPHEEAKRRLMERFG